MAVDVVMPQMGESIFEGTITKWLKKPGDKVERDEPLFEISTDKVDAEIPAPAAGVLREIKIAEGQTVPVKTVVAVIDAAGADSSAAPVSPRANAPESATASVSASLSKQPPATAQARPPEKAAEATPGPGSAASAPTAPAPRGNGQAIRSSPLVRRLAREKNIDLAAVRGTGTGGRISKSDILAAISSSLAASAQPHAAAADPGTHALLETAVPRERIYFGRYQVQPMSVMRQRIAEHMVLSKRISPHVYSVDEADMTHVAQSRAAAKSEFEKRNETKLTFMPFFVRACAEALRAFPLVNASVDGTNVVLHGEINIGIAVALEAGLIVPVVKNAGEKKFVALQRSINDLAERARAKKLKPEEVQESTFSITNPGIFGGLMGFPVINQPNAAILAVGAIQKRPVVVDDAIAIRSMVYLVLSYDHRIVDGAIAHQFMEQVKRRLETWDEEIV
jgi:pyruvate dehydrogenase E2 component (dihydrolipoamide acetyltransferase)